MKKQTSLAEFFKSKSFYALLCVATLAIIAMAIVGLNESSQKGTDLNEITAESPNSEGIKLSQDTNNPTSNEIVNIPSDTTLVVEETREDGFYVGETRPEDIYENDVLVEGTELTAEGGEEISVVEDTQTPEVVETKPQNTEEIREVMQPEPLYFDQESKISWPIVGEVMIGYGRFFDSTLQQSRSHEGIAIRANVGDQVKAATAGTVLEVYQDDRTGVTVKVSVGSGYNMIYGQLESVTVEAGDTMKEGHVIGNVAYRTKFYSEQGNSLYFQMENEEGTFDPMLYLARVE